MPLPALTGRASRRRPRRPGRPPAVPSSSDPSVPTSVARPPTTVPSGSSTVTSEPSVALAGAVRGPQAAGVRVAADGVPGLEPAGERAERRAEQAGAVEVVRRRRASERGGRRQVRGRGHVEPDADDGGRARPGCRPAPPGRRRACPRPAARTSLGHFSAAVTPATASTASATARPVASGSQPQRSSGTPSGRIRTEKVRPAPRRGRPAAAEPAAPEPLVLGDQDVPRAGAGGGGGAQVGVRRVGLRLTTDSAQGPGGKAARTAASSRRERPRVGSHTAKAYGRGHRPGRSARCIGWCGPLPSLSEESPWPNTRSTRAPPDAPEIDIHSTAGKLAELARAARRGRARRLRARRRQAARQGQDDRPRARRGVPRRRLLHRARRVRPAPLDGLRHGGEPSVRRRRRHRLRHASTAARCACSRRTSRSSAAPWARSTARRSSRSWTWRSRPAARSSASTRAPARGSRRASSPSACTARSSTATSWPPASSRRSR